MKRPLKIDRLHAAVAPGVQSAAARMVEQARKLGIVRGGAERAAGQGSEADRSLAANSVSAVELAGQIVLCAQARGKAISFADALRTAAVQLQAARMVEQARKQGIVR